MADTSRQSLAAALSFILEDSGIIVLDYCNADIFRDLWLNGLTSETPEINGQALNWQSSDQTIVIVGNDAPEGVFDKSHPSLKGINFQDHFTASSWLAAWKVKFTPSAEERRNGKSEPMTKIAVVDSRRSNLVGGVARSLQTILGAHDSREETLIPRAAVLNFPSLSTICKWLKAAKADTRPTAPHLPELLKASIWNELTSDRDQNHALSNVLGAFLLRAEVGGGTPPLEIQKFQSFLNALVSACGAGPLSVGDGQTCVWIDRAARQKIETAVLIDDMAELWEGFVSGALGTQKLLTTAQGKFRESMLGTVGLPERLIRFLEEKRRQLCTSDLVPQTANNTLAIDATSRFVLFLDLRLGLGEEFLKRLAAFGLRLLASGRKLAWLDQPGREALRIELERVQSNEADRVQMHSLPPEETLLPRLLSLLDPTLPIVNFSSTHRSELVEPFRNYGNIITTFRKPTLAGAMDDWKTVVCDLRADLDFAMRQAGRILDIRRNLARLEIGECALVPQREKGRRRVIEIYIDESGDPFNQHDPGFAVGGVILQHDSEAAQKAFHRFINHSPRKWGVSDYAPDRIRAQDVDSKLPTVSFFPKRPAPDGTDEKEGLELVSSALTAHSRIGAFALVEPNLLRLEKDNRLDSAILFDHNSLDNVYHTLLRTNLELLLFQHPWIDLNSDSLFIHVATREQKIDDQNTRRIWQQAYGMEFRERRGKWGYTSIGGDDVFRLVREILRSRGGFGGHPDIVMARGVTLNDYEDVLDNFSRGPQLRARVNSQLFDPSRTDPNQVHYLADWITRIALYREHLPGCVESWFAHGYIQPWSDEFSALLDSCRAAELDKSVRRLRGVELTPVEDLRRGLLAERYLRQTAESWLGHISGSQLRRLFGLDR